MEMDPKQKHPFVLNNIYIHLLKKIKLQLIFAENQFNSRDFSRVPDANFRRRANNFSGPRPRSLKIDEPTNFSGEFDICPTKHDKETVSIDTARVNPRGFARNMPREKASAVIGTMPYKLQSTADMFYCEILLDAGHLMSFNCRPLN